MSHPQRSQMIYEGKAKQVFATTDPELLWIHYKDSATAFDGAKKAEIEDKGEVNCQISARLLDHVARETGVRHHLVELLSSRDQLVHRVEIIPIEVVVRNVVAGSLAKRFGRTAGEVLPRPMVEFFYKSDALHDPPMSEEHALLFGWAERWELEYLRAAALKVNASLQGFWDGLGVTLVDFKLEFGRHASGAILLADEITPDGSRLWEKGTNRKLDKDVFRWDLGSLTDTYRELYARVFGAALHGASPSASHDGQEQT